MPSGTLSIPTHSSLPEGADGGAVRKQLPTDGTVPLQGYRGVPCKAKDCQCVGFEKPFASNVSVTLLHDPPDGVRNRLGV